MDEKKRIPGPVRVMYGAYLGLFALVLYTGFNYFNPFLSGWRYPWLNSYAILLNFAAAWAMVLISIVYLYYAYLGKKEDWGEPLGIFRAFIAVLTIWYFLLTYAVYDPTGWLRGMVQGLGGIAETNLLYAVFSWVMILVVVIYLYARWAKSERFPKLRAPKSE